MGWSSESQFRCRKHQNRKQPEEGVCPFCLRERLSQLSSSTSRRISVVAPSCSSSLSPGFYSSTTAASSKDTSPRLRGQHHRNVSDVMMGSLSSGLGGVGGSSRLKKSRSMAFAPRNFVAEVKSKKRGFWSKLLHFEGKKGNFMHSKTVKERL